MRSRASTMSTPLAVVAATRARRCGPGPVGPSPVRGDPAGFPCGLMFRPLLILFVSRAVHAVQLPCRLPSEDDSFTNHELAGHAAGAPEVRLNRFTGPGVSLSSLGSHSYIL